MKLLRVILLLSLPFLTSFRMVYFCCSSPNNDVSLVFSYRIFVCAEHDHWKFYANGYLWILNVVYKCHLAALYFIASSSANVRCHVRTYTTISLITIPFVANDHPNNGSSMPFRVIWNGAGQSIRDIIDSQLNCQQCDPEQAILVPLNRWNCFRSCPLFEFIFTIIRDCRLMRNFSAAATKG